MSNPYIGEIRMFGGNFAPQGWAFCNGQILAIAENDTLFQLIGTTYGGDGQETFALPNLQSRVPIHSGQGPGLSNYNLGQAGGVENVTLTVSQIPVHSHPPAGSSGAGNSPTPAGGVWAATTAAKQFAPGASVNVNMNSAALGGDGGSQPHDNMVPYLAINFIISLFGIFPSQS